jgi:hypothetical protein
MYQKEVKTNYLWIKQVSGIFFTLENHFLVYFIKFEVDLDFGRKCQKLQGLLYKS